MTKENNESGKTMLEMLSVIVIIFVLTIGSLATYGYLVQYHNRQETVKNISTDT